MQHESPFDLPALAQPPGPPAADHVRLFGRSLGGRILPASLGPSGLDSMLQPALFRNKVGLWMPGGNTATVPVPQGFANAFTTLGTATARNVAATSMATRARRQGYVSSALVGNFAGHYYTAAQFSLGVAATVPYGGFLLVYRFLTSDAATRTGARQFIGVSSSVAAPTNVEPNTLTNAIGVAQLSTSNNLSIVYGGSAAQAAINLGAGFPANTLTADLYELALFCAPGVNNAVGYRVERMNTGDVAVGTLTAATPGTQLPLNSTLLAPRAWRCNNANLAAVGLDVVSLYMETDD